MGKKKQKYYAVRKGRNTGIYNSWVEAEKQIKGFPGAEYKSFLKLEDAKAYLSGKKECECPEMNENTILAYIDGSYKDNIYSSGIVLCDKNGMTEYYFWGEESLFKEGNNIPGEIMAALFVMDYAVKNDIKKVILKFDLEGLEKWAKEEYKTKKLITKVYKYYYEYYKQKGLLVEFKKVQGHSGDFCNDKADKLAKKALVKDSNVNFDLPDFEKILEMLKGYSVNQNLSIQLSDKELESLIEYLKNEKYEIHEEINSDKKRFDIKSKFFKDYLVLTYHLWSRKLQIQGKARDVLNNIELFLAEFGKTQDLLQKVYDVSRSEYNDFEQTVDKIVHGAYTHEKVSETLKGLMITAYFNYLESPNMPYRDFSFYLIPAARVLEAFIKWGLYMFKIADKLPEKEAIGNYFERIEKSNSFTIKKEFRENCNCEDDLIVIEKCYNYYHKYRHIYSHASPIEGHTSTISSKQEVNDLIMTALKLTGELFNRFPL